MDSYQREIKDFLVDYGATGIGITQTGKHPKIEFEFNGKHVAYTIASSSSDHRAAANSISELRRMLGEPIAEEETPSRRLAEMLPPATERVVYRGRIAMYGSRLQFIFPPDLVRLIGINVNDKFEVSRLDKNTWHLHKIISEDATIPRVRQEGFILFYAPPSKDMSLTKGLSNFSRTDADYTVVGDALVVHLTGHLSPPDPSRRRPLLYGDTPDAPAAPDPEPLPPALEGEDVPARLRYILALVQSAERQTGYRLVKLRRENEADGSWVWRAPDIRLD